MSWIHPRSGQHLLPICSRLPPTPAAPPQIADGGNQKAGVLVYDGANKSPDNRKGRDPPTKGRIMASELGSPQLPTREGRESASANEKASTSAKMATLSDLRETKEALDAGLVSQADFDDVKRDYLRAQKEFLKRELEEKKEALVEFQKRELLAKEEFQQRKANAELRVFALESIIKHGASIMSEDQKSDLVREYLKMSGLDRLPANSAGALGADPASKRQRLDERAVTHMKEVFQRTQKPSKEERHKIAEIFGITKNQVWAWFWRNRDAPPPGPLTPSRAPPAPPTSELGPSQLQSQPGGGAILFRVVDGIPVPPTPAHLHPPLLQSQDGGGAIPSDLVSVAHIESTRFERAVAHMRKVFQKTPNPPMDETLRIAEMFGLTKKLVIDWFANQRTKMKRSKESN